MVACCYKSTTAADRLFAFVELTSLVFNLHGVTSLVFNLYGLTSHVLPLCTQFSKLNIAGLRCFSDLSTQWECGEVSSQIHGEVSQEYQNIDIARFPLAPFIYLGCSKKCKTKATNIGLNIDNSICFDKVKVATHFNNFF